MEYAICLRDYIELAPVCNGIRIHPIIDLFVYVNYEEHINKSKNQCN